MDKREEALKAFIAIKRNNEKLESAVKADVKEYDLNLNEFAVLELLFHRGRQPIQKIKERILIASSSTTYIIDKLCSKGLTFREYDEEDRRVIYVMLTNKGQELVEDIFPGHAQVIEECFENLTLDELKQLRYLLKKMSGIEPKGEE